MLARFLCLVITGLLLSACAVDPQGSSAEDERDLRALWRSFEQAFNAGDAEAVANFYAPDADRIGADGELVVGRDKILTRYEATLARRRADPTTVPFHAEIRVRLLSREVALLDGFWSGVRDGGVIRGHFTLTAKKLAGRWLIAAGRDRGVISS